MEVIRTKHTITLPTTDCTSLHHIVLSDSEICHIGPSAFQGCASLRTLELLDSLERVEESTFADCTNLIHVRLSSSLKYIGQNAFRNCTSLRNANLPRELLELDDGAFSGCERLLSCRILPSLKRIGNKCFSKCDTLMIVALLKTLSHDQIGKHAFQGCDLITEQATTTTHDSTS